MDYPITNREIIHTTYRCVDNEKMFYKLFSELADLGRYLYRTVLIAVLFSCSFLFYKDNRCRLKERLVSLIKQKWIFAFILYSSFIFVSTVLGRPKTNPYQDIFSNFGFRKDDFAWNIDIIKNIVLFIPFTYFFLKAHIAYDYKHGFITSLLLSFITTIFIELSQLLFWLGSFQFADIVHNIIGGLIGYLLWLLDGLRKKHS